MMQRWQGWVAGLAIGAGLAAGAAASELAGTQWRLVEIQSMDDSLYVPDDPTQYLLELKSDGTATLQADCNRATGSWSSKRPGHIEFGPLAATSAECAPGSISARYLAQFPWVRSYVLEEGNLFLATMADGSIIMFAPGDNPEPAASVLGEPIRATDPTEAQAAILTALLDRYAAERGIEAEPGEVDAFVEKLKLGLAREGLGDMSDLTPAEVAEVEAGRREMGRSIIRQWKINKALYERYGGRIIYQQFGPEPLDAYRRFLEEAQARGDFTIHDPALADSFWGYFRDDGLHDFMEPGSADEARAFTAAPWQDAP